MADAVLDSSAVLAVILEEPGAERVEDQLPGARISAVNLGEVVAKLRDLGASRSKTEAIVAGLKLEFREHHVDQALIAGNMRPSTRSAGLSLGDRACLALARALDLPAMTADRRWLEVADAVGVRVEMIR